MAPMKRLWLALAAGALLASACSSSAPTPPAASTAAPPVAATAAAPAGGAGTGGDAATQGKATFGTAGCVTCHGDKAQGNVFPGAAKLSGTALTCDQVKAQVRNPRDPSKGMPQFAPAVVSDAAIENVCAWLKTNP